MFRADWVRRLSLARDLLELLAGGRFSATQCRRQQGPFGFLRCNIEIDRSTPAWFKLLPRGCEDVLEYALKKGFCQFL